MEKAATLLMKTKIAKQLDLAEAAAKSWKHRRLS